jgi:hypothetical protein
MSLTDGECPQCGSALCGARLGVMRGAIQRPAPQQHAGAAASSELEHNTQINMLTPPCSPHAPSPLAPIVAAPSPAARPTSAGPARTAECAPATSRGASPRMLRPLARASLRQCVLRATSVARYREPLRCAPSPGRQCSGAGSIRCFRVALRPHDKGALQGSPRQQAADRPSACNRRLQAPDGCGGVISCPNTCQPGTHCRDNSCADGGSLEPPGVTALRPGGKAWGVWACLGPLSGPRLELAEPNDVRPWLVVRRKRARTACGMAGCAAQAAACLDPTGPVPALHASQHAGAADPCLHQTSCPSTQQCGTYTDACGGVIFCGACPKGEACDPSGLCVKDPVPCTPASKCPSGRVCGYFDDGW